MDIGLKRGEGKAMNEPRRETMKREKNYVVYSRETGEAISYHKSADLADGAARKIDPALRKADSKRIS
jgi:hypothetical protein